MPRNVVSTVFMVVISAGTEFRIVASVLTCPEMLSAPCLWLLLVQVQSSDNAENVHVLGCIPKRILNLSVCVLLWITRMNQWLMQWRVMCRNAGGLAPVHDVNPWTIHENYSRCLAQYSMLLHNETISNIPSIMTLITLYIIWHYDLADRSLSYPP